MPNLPVRHRIFTQQPESTKGSDQSKDMITVLVQNHKTFSQESYEKIVESLDFFAIRCSCGHAGCLIKYGSYKRTVRIGTERIEFSIQRVFCNNCRRTHALLLSVMVPYSQIALSIQTDIILNHESGDNRSIEVLAENPVLDEREVCCIIAKYKRFWKQRCLSAEIALTDSLILSCFHAYSMQFMQIRRGINILFVPPT